VKILRSKTNAEVTNPPATETTAAAPRARVPVPPRAPSSSKTRNKVLLSVADGKIEWEKMSPESRKQFEEMFQNPEFLAAFGLTGKSAAFDPEQMKFIYDAVGTGYQAIVAMFLRWPPEALRLLAYTPDQKNILAEPTAKLANKFAPAFLMKHQELLVWGAVFGSVTQANFLQASAKAKELEKLKQKPVSGLRVVAPAPASSPAPTFEVPFAPPVVNGEQN